MTNPTKKTIGQARAVTADNTKHTTNEIRMVTTTMDKKGTTIAKENTRIRTINKTTKDEKRKMMRTRSAKTTKRLSNGSWI